MQHLASSSDFDQHFDKWHLWHPYASLPPSYQPIIIKKARGVYLCTHDGKWLIDGMSSWWASIHGYNHPTLNQAIKDQLDHMSHVMFGGLTHTTAIELGRALLQIVPNGLEKIFYADSGSVAVEVALKTTLQYQLAKKNPHKNRFASTRSGYHGDTWHAMSVCDPVTGMHSLYGTQLPVQYFLPAPPMGFHQPISDEYRAILDTFFDKYHDQLAGFIIEPIAQGAGGMRFYSPQILSHIYQLCQQHDILFIADEIATGFGRTGKMFACEWANITPDIMTIGKALTGGYMSFGAMLTTHRVSDTIYHSDNPAIMHGPTFMGNPLACAVSLASVQLCIQNNTPARATALEQQLKQHLMPASKLSQVADVRCLGAIGVIELNEPVHMPTWQAMIANYGIWVRPFGKLVYIMPPLIISDDKLTYLCRQLLKLLCEYEKQKP